MGEDSKSPAECLMCQGGKAKERKFVNGWGLGKRQVQPAKSKGCCTPGDEMRQQLGHEFQLKRLSSQG